ncbi:hypothetical protein [Sinorhizobium meliloti]|uniref:hypothetical protein n=1 Tax=Rhizobium meliloti TaxID=382 RepID=UPI0013E365D8|nr:hypothetical protein [Sinorhizobium meliloti]MDE3829352.1 hypothetical protein [Sinorhizobium meliloti]MDE4577437.1 hypothetical protein [Sinorhizobium meliloti]
MGLALVGSRVARSPVSLPLFPSPDPALELLAMTEHFIGHKKARLEASPNRFFVACAILALSIAFLMSAALAGTTAFRKEWQYVSEAKV